MSAFRHGRRNTKQGMGVFKKLFIALLLMGVLTVATAGLWFKATLAAVDKDNTTAQEFTVVTGMNVAGLGAQLEDDGLIKSAFSYRIYSRINRSHTNLQAGVYSLSPSMSTSEIASKIAGGKVSVSLLTILPAQRIDQLEQSFIDHGFSQTEIDDALDPRQYEGLSILSDKPPLASLEGYLYPDSFQVSSNTSLKTVIESSLELMDRNFTQQMRDDILNKQGLDVHEAIVVASIVEKEVDGNTDRTKVAQVFLTRYRESISLGSDVTAFYGAQLYGLDRSVNTDTPYNTRLHLGLPPGPINNVGVQSLSAVANPADTDYLFFVAGDDGVTYFSRTLAEHESLTAQHCIELCR